jgi:hypothetical protein
LDEVNVEAVLIDAAPDDREYFAVRESFEMRSSSVIEANHG